MQNTYCFVFCPVDPASIQGSHRSISFIRIKHRTRANDNLCKCLMYHAACKVLLQPLNRSYSQLTFSIFSKYVVLALGQLVHLCPFPLYPALLPMTSTTRVKSKGDRVLHRSTTGCAVYVGSCVHRGASLQVPKGSPIILYSYRSYGLYYLSCYIRTIC